MNELNDGTEEPSTCFIEDLSVNTIHDQYSSRAQICDSVSTSRKYESVRTTARSSAPRTLTVYPVSRTGVGQ